MFVTLKSKDGYNVDVTSQYIKALEGSITPQEWKGFCDVVTNKNKNV